MDDEFVLVEIFGVGYGLYWEVFDVDFFVLGFLVGVFGIRVYMVCWVG